jgi:hypothetical protein
VRDDFGVDHSSGYRKGWSLVETVLFELCSERGICLGPEEHAQMLEMPTDDLDAFVNAIFRADGFEEPYERRLWRGVRDHVALRFAETPR